MKKLHLICGNNPLNEAQQFIRFTFDKTYATNGHVAAILSTKDVMPGILEEGEELFISAKDWKATSAFEAQNFIRMNGQIMVHSKKGTMILPFKTNPTFRYPDIEWAVPSSFDASLNYFGLNPKMYASLMDALGYETAKLRFSAVNKAIKVEPFTWNTQTREAVYADLTAIIMPLAV